MGHLARKSVLSLVHNPVIAATTDAVSSWVDMANWEGCQFMGTLGAGTTSMTVKVQFGASTTATGTDLTGAAITVLGADDNKGFAFDVYSPHSQGRFLRTEISDLSGGGVWDFGGVLALQYDGRVSPMNSTGLVDTNVDLVVVQTT